MSTFVKKLPSYCHGAWHVTTEGDVEGRSTRDLGVWIGNIDDVAFALADQAYYSLRFKPAKNPSVPTKFTRTDVDISFDIDTGTWDMLPEERVHAIADWLFSHGRQSEVRVAKGNGYATVKLITKRPEKVLCNIAERTLKNLSAEEIEALRVHFDKVNKRSD